MKKTISILQISDIHKPEIGNYEHLYQSIVDDCNRYVGDEHIEKPNFIVVCGDIINGGTTKQIKEQYNDVSSFLNKLCDYFLDSNKDRIFIVPGNHDVDWNVSTRSMIRLSFEDTLDSMSKKKEIIKYLRSNNNQGFRWSWQDYNVYRIFDEELYKKRFLNYQLFYNSFFAENPKRRFAINTDEQFYISAFEDYRVAFVEFNSAYLTDHLCDIGGINKMCITKASDRLYELSEMGYLIFAIWHHNVYGVPYQSNYMDRNLLRLMMLKGVQVGLYGHNHQSEILYEERKIEPRKEMMIIGTGTLYGNRDTLPTGIKRTYNIININIENDDMAYMCVHNRESVDVNSDEIPEWTRGYFEQSQQSIWNEQIKLCPFIKKRKKSKQNKTMNTIKYEHEINEALLEYEQTGNGENLIETLTNLDVNDELVRKFLLQILLKMHRPDRIIDFFSNPQNDAEIIALLQAAETMPKNETIKTIQQNKLIKNSSNAIIQDLLTHYIFQKKI